MLLADPGDTAAARALVDGAHRIARRIGAAGVGTGGRVAVCLEREPLMVQAALGVLASGASYVPLDPMLPPERLRLMLEDARVDLVLVQERLRDRFPAGSVAAPVVALDAAGDGGWADDLAAQPVLEDELVPIMTGLVQCTSLMSSPKAAERARELDAQVI